MSSSARHPEGLANASGMVGRNFMVHVQSLVLGLFEDPTDCDSGTVGTVASRQFYETDPDKTSSAASSSPATRAYSPVLTALQVRPWGRDHHPFVERHVNREGAVYVCGDDSAGARQPRRARLGLDPTPPDCPESRPTTRFPRTAASWAWRR